MGWVRTEDGAPLHPKFFRAGVTAFGWWMAAICYCNRYLTDGFIPQRDAVLIYPGTVPATVTESIEILVREGLLEVCDEGWQIHDYEHYQPLKKDIIKSRRDHVRAGRQGGINKAKKDLATATAGAMAVAMAKKPTQTNPNQPNPTSNGTGPHFVIPASITEALNQCPTLSSDSRLRDSGYWQAEVRANASVNIAQCLLNAEGWLKAKNVRKKNYALFIHNWLRNQERDA